MPFMLRKQEDQYCVVGPCFVFGMMDGEAVEMCETGELVEDEFDLR